MRRDYWILILLALVVLSAGIGLRDPWPADEPRFNLVARQMWESGQYLITYRGVELYSDKPPMYMWLQVASYALTGSWRVAFLLPSLLAAIGTIALLHDLARRLWSRRAAWWASAMLLLTLQFCFQAKRAQIDAALMLMMMVSLYGLLRHLLCGPDWRWYAIGWLAAGVATITKGVGFLTLLILLPYGWARWRGWSGITALGWRDWRWLTGPLCFVIAVCAWLLPMLQATYGSGDPALIAYADDLLFRQTAERYVDSWHHEEPFYYYLGVIPAMWLPASLLLPWLLPAWRRRWRRGDARIWIPLLWALMVVVFFSFSPGKRDVYIMPALPMVMLAAAPLFAGLWRIRGAQRLAGITALLLSGILFLVGAWALLGEPSFALRRAPYLDGRDSELWWLALTSGALGLAACAWYRWRRGLLAYGALMVVFWALIYGWWGPAIINGVSSARTVMENARTLVGPQITLGLVAWQEQNLLQAVPPATNFGFERFDWGEQWIRAQAWLREDPAHRRIFIRDGIVDECLDLERVLDAGISNQRRWWIVPEQALIPGCVTVPEK